MIRTRPPTARRVRRPALEPLEARTLLTTGLQYYGGPVMPNVAVTTIFYGAQWGTDSTLSAYRARLDTYFNLITDSTWMDILKQYSVTSSTPIVPSNGGPASPTPTPIGHGSFAGEDKNLPSLPSSGDAVDDSQIQTMLEAEIAAGGVNPVDQNQLYFVFTPPGETVTDSGQTSWVDFIGYHSSFSDAGKEVIYAVIPLPPGPGDAASQGFPSDFADMTDVSSHELAESVTDPWVGEGFGIGFPLGWYDADPSDPNGGGEVADLADSSGNVRFLHGYDVQELWSNQEFPHDVLEVDQPISIRSITSSTSAGLTAVSVVLHDTDNTYRLRGTAGDFIPFFTWGDGPGPTVVGITVKDLGGGDFQFSASHTYAKAGSPLFSVFVRDVGGAGASGSQMLSIPSVLAQTITFGAAPASAVYNTTFLVNPTSTSGLPVTLTGTNCTIVPNPDGPGYDVTMTSGSNDATLSADQAGSASYSPAATVSLIVKALKANQTITWSTPAPIPYGAPLTATQLDATVGVIGPAAAGALVYTPGLGAVLTPGMQTLAVTAQATDNYNAATVNVTLHVLSAAEQADILIQEVDALVSSGVLNGGDGNALTSKLALKGDHGDTGKAKAFADQVSVFLSTGRLTRAQAAPLLSGASDLLRSFSLS